MNTGSVDTFLITCQIPNVYADNMFELKPGPGNTEPVSIKVLFLFRPLGIVTLSKCNSTT
jgi:hypothetical protein